MRRLAVLAVLAGLATPGLAAGQVSYEPAALSDGQRIRLVLCPPATPRLVEGLYAGRDGSDLTVIAETRRTIPVRAIEAVYVSHGRNRGIGALAGAVLGGVGTYVFAVAANSASETASFAGIFIPVGIVAGGVAGFVIGGPEEWRPAAAPAGSGSGGLGECASS